MWQQCHAVFAVTQKAISLRLFNQLNDSNVDQHGYMFAQTTQFDILRNLEFTGSDFERVRKLIYRLAGIALNESSQEFVYVRLLPRLRALGQQCFKDYLDELERRTRPSEQTEFVNALTTNLTSFFRETYHFPILAEHLKHTPQPWRIWCSAASTGEEAYSIAMTAVEALGEFSDQIKIIASDINTQVLAHAELGIYRDERVAKLSHERVHRFFVKDTARGEQFVRVRPELRRMVEFVQLNLLDAAWPLAAPFDAIFCRNVMIYFDEPTQTSVLRRMVPLLKPRALLFAGHCENFLPVCDSLERRGLMAYSAIE